MSEQNSTGPEASQASAELVEGADPMLCTIRLRGELDMSSVELVKGCFEEAVVRHPHRLVVEVGELSFMDSTGVALLLNAAAKLPEVEVKNPSRIVRTVLDSLGLGSVLIVSEQE